MTLKPPLGANLPVGYETRAEVIFEAPINVQYPEYGATGDGVTDDTAAIDAALDAADVANAAEVYFPPGTYVTDGNQIPSNCRVFGAGVGATVLKLGDSAPVMTGIPHPHRCILSNRESATGFENITIEAFELDGNVANNHADQQTHGIELWGGTGLTIRDIYAHDTRACGIFLASATSGSVQTVDALVENVRLENCGFLNGGPGVAWSGLAAVHARGLTIRGVRATEIGAFAVLFETDNTGEVFDDCLVEDVAAEDAVAGVGIYGRSGGVCSRNTIRGVRVRDGGGGRLTNAVILDYNDGVLVDGVRSDTALTYFMVIPTTNTAVTVRNVLADRCLLTRTAAQTAIVTATQTVVEWDAETADPGSMHDLTSATTRKKITAVVPGLYSVTATLKWSGTTGTYREAALRKNGTTIVGTTRAGAATATHSHAFPAVELAVDDYVEVLAAQDSGGNLDLAYDAGIAPVLSVVKTG